MRFRRRSAYYSRADSYSRSYNAECAEDEGRFPLTRAIAPFYEKYNCKKHGITKKVVKQFLQMVHDGEWHHVGKYANEVNYHRTAGYSLDELKTLIGLKRKAAAKC